jgi:hypothetical protein
MGWLFGVELFLFFDKGKYRGKAYDCKVVGSYLYHIVELEVN